MPIYQGGFKSLHDKYPEELGNPLEDETFLKLDGGKEISLQMVEGGLLWYSKQANTPMYLRPYFGESAQPIGPVQVNYDYPGVVAGTFAGTPAGVILHGSRSGHSGNPEGEFWGTSRYAVNEPNGLGWSATIGPGLVSIHMRANQWGYNARGASSKLIGVEFAQGTIDDPITDPMIDAFCWFFKWCLQTYPGLPTYFPTHGELDNTPIYGGYFDGKTDIYGKGDGRADEVRNRILAKL